MSSALLFVGGGFPVFLYQCSVGYVVVGTRVS